MTPTNTSAPQPTKKSSVRHTRAIQRDRRKRPLAAPPDAAITARLTELIQPATLVPQATAAALGLRDRKLPLPVMVATPAPVGAAAGAGAGVVITLIWRQIGAGGSEIARLLASEGVLWVGILVVSQQAISLRLRTFPAAVFLARLHTLLPVLQARWQARQRPNASTAGLGPNALYGRPGDRWLDLGRAAAPSRLAA